MKFSSLGHFVPSHSVLPFKFFLKCSPAHIHNQWLLLQGYKDCCGGISIPELLTSAESNDPEKKLVLQGLIYLICSRLLCWDEFSPAPDPTGCGDHGKGQHNLLTCKDSVEVAPLLPRVLP